MGKYPLFRLGHFQVRKLLVTLPEGKFHHDLTESDRSLKKDG